MLLTFPYFQQNRGGGRGEGRGHAVFQMTNVRVSNDVMLLTDRNISNVFTGEKNSFFSSRVKLPFPPDVYLPEIYI
jgi:hypothetical protein